MGEEFFAGQRKFNLGVLDVRQGELTKYGEKRPARTALSVYEYRFLSPNDRCADRTVKFCARRRKRKTKKNRQTPRRGLSIFVVH